MHESTVNTKPLSERSQSGPINAGRLARLEHDGALPRRLWSSRDYAEFLGVGERTFHELESSGVLADPVILGPRLKRYVPSECQARLLEFPRQRAAEPSQLRRARIDRMKAGPSTSDV